jgi:hypothetical protein
MNIDKIVDQLPLIFASLGILLWAWAKLTEAKAKSNPAEDWWDKQAPRAVWAQRLYAQAIDWLVEAGAAKWAGADKLAELNKRAKAFEDKVQAGDYISAVGDVIGAWQDAKEKAFKAGKLGPFLPTPGPSIIPSSQGDTEMIGPNDPAQPPK